VTKWEYAVKHCAVPALQTVLREYGHFGWEFVQVLEVDQTRGLTVIFKRPEQRGGSNVYANVAPVAPVLSANAAKAQFGMDDLASLEDQEGTGSDSATRSGHPSASFDGVSSASRVC